MALLVEFHHTVTPGVTHRIRKDPRAARQGGRGAQLIGESVPEEDIVPQDQAGGFAGNEIPADQEGIRQAARMTGAAVWARVEVFDA